MTTLSDCLTTAEAAAKLDVSIQRVHVLCEKYGVHMLKVSPRCSLIPKSEMRKIPSNRERRKHCG